MTNLNLQKMKRNKSLLYVILIVLAFIILYVIIWIVFLFNGPISTGEGISKRDWLLFLSGYLSFVGTISVSIMVIVQNSRYRKIDKERNRLQNMPTIKFSKAYLYNEFKSINFSEFKENIKDPDVKKMIESHSIDPKEEVIIIDNCPLITWKDDRFECSGSDNSKTIILVKDIPLRAIYIAENIGLGTAVSFTIRSNNTKDSKYVDNYNYGGKHLKPGEKVYFEISLKEMKDQKDLDLEVEVLFGDIFGNKYSQKCNFNMKIIGTKFNFDIKRKDDEAKLLETFANKRYM